MVLFESSALGVDDSFELRKGDPAVASSSGLFEVVLDDRQNGAFALDVVVLLEVTRGFIGLGELQESGVLLQASVDFIHLVRGLLGAHEFREVPDDQSFLAKNVVLGVEYLKDVGLKVNFRVFDGETADVSDDLSEDELEFGMVVLP